MTLTERKKADRETMAAMVEALCVEMNIPCSRDPDTVSREIVVRIEPRDAVASIEFDGSHFNTQPNVFCMPWNIQYESTKRFSEAFGCAVGSEVNPFHRRKCMGFADGIDSLLLRLRAAMACINRGDAFEIAEARVAA